MLIKNYVINIIINDFIFAQNFGVDESETFLYTFVMYDFGER